MVIVMGGGGAEEAISGICRTWPTVRLWFGLRLLTLARMETGISRPTAMPLREKQGSEWSIF